MSFDGYVVVDVETTGLDPAVCDLLEVGILVADKNFHILSQFSEVIYFDLDKHVGIDGFVVDMHTKNGLWAECKVSTHSLGGVEKSAIEFLKAEGVEGQPMCGSTIQFDRSFISYHMPELNKRFHYRHIDVSSFKNVFKKYGWSVTTPPVNAFATPHRAGPDCFTSLKELESYVDGIQQWKEDAETFEFHICEFDE